jgi:SAM-dependent methyltransferase
MMSDNTEGNEDMRYQDINKKTIDNWVEDGWIWGVPIDHETFEKVVKGIWDVVLTPTKPVPKAWFPPLKGAKVLGLASGGGQQIPVFAALGSVCTVLDYSPRQLESERVVAVREGYDVTLVEADMTLRLPFDDASFDLVFHPVSNCYVEDVSHVFKEAFRVLKKGGILLSGLDIGINYVVDDDETSIVRGLPFNPLKDKEIEKFCLEGDWGMQFSHTLEEQIGGQLKAGFVLTDIYEDTNGQGRLHQLNIPSFIATRAVKP